MYVGKAQQHMHACTKAQTHPEYAPMNVSGRLTPSHSAITANIEPNGTGV